MGKTYQQMNGESLPDFRARCAAAEAAKKAVPWTPTMEQDAMAGLYTELDSAAKEKARRERWNAKRRAARAAAKAQTAPVPDGWASVDA
jgi:hypothetical protein